LAVYNDREHAVEVVMDRDLWASEAFQFHPLVNTRTLVIPKKSIQRFLEATGHPLEVVDVPG